MASWVGRGTLALRQHARGAAQLRTNSTWSAVMDQAKRALLGKEGSGGKDAVASLVRDPLDVVGSELSALRHNITSLLGSGHPSLDRIARYYFQAEGKHVRPMIVLLIAKATNGLSGAWNAQRAAHVGEDVDRAISPTDVLNDENPRARQAGAPPCPGTAAPPAAEPMLADVILPTQRRLAEITEMIHVASLLHDDVIDASDTRRGAPSAPSTFGNKLSILGGDFLLGRASIALARLRDAEVTELMSTVIANLVEGEVMQMRSAATDSVPVTDVHSSLPNLDAVDAFWPPGEPGVEPTRERFEQYLQKTYLKTASLMAKSARSSAVLGGCSERVATQYGLSTAAQQDACRVCDAAYQFGRNAGLAFQLVDDLLDFKSTSEAFGKPSGGADLKLGLATAPVLYAWKQFPHSALRELVPRKFSQPGDVPTAMELILRSDGLERTAQLAKYHADLASKALEPLPESDARKALLALTEQIVQRIR